MTPPQDRFGWERLIRELRLPGPAKCVAYALATYANGDGTRAHPGVRNLMTASGYGRARVLTALAELERLGLIVTASRGGGKGSRRGLATVYELSVPLPGTAEFKALESLKTWST